MKKCIKDILIRDWIDVDDRVYADEAIARIENDYPYSSKHIKVNHSKEIDKDMLFGCPIDDAIRALKTLKDEGYTSISEEWSSYEHNYFVADRYEMETDEEAVARLYPIINREIDKIREEIEEIKEKKNRIKELEAEVKRLKKGLR